MILWCAADRPALAASSRAYDCRCCCRSIEPPSGLIDALSNHVAQPIGCDHKKCAVPFAACVLFLDVARRRAAALELFEGRVHVVHLEEAAVLARVAAVF